MGAMYAVTVRFKESAKTLFFHPFEFVLVLDIATRFAKSIQCTEY